MFVPDAFAETDREALHALIETHPFGLLISIGGNGLETSHLPFVLDRARGAHGTLAGHVARANPHGEALFDGGPALAVFSGPHAYISPRWYRPGNAVPTWNYAVVHAHGTPRLIDDPAAVRRQQEALIARFEGPDGWSLADQPAAYIDAMLNGIVAFELPIDRLVGKFKLSQNRSADDRHGVVANLAASPDPAATALAALMAARVS